MPHRSVPSALFPHEVTATSTTLSGLTNGERCHVQVRAKTSNDVGPWSVSSEEEPSEEPGQLQPCPADAAPFTDVGAGHWAFEHVDCVCGLGVTTGTAADVFSPEQNVTRAQMAAFLSRMWQALV